MRKCPVFTGLFFRSDAMGELNKPLARADRTSHGFNAKTPVTAPKNRLAENIPTFDNFSCPIADGARCAPHAAATMAPALCMFFLFLSLLVFPHGQAPIEITHSRTI